MDKYDKYIKVCNWALARYQIDGQVIVFRNSLPTTYTNIENLAAVKYLGCKPIHQTIKG